MTSDAAAEPEITDVAELARRLRTEAVRTNERRGLVLAGDRDAGIDAAYTAIEALEDRVDVGDRMEVEDRVDVGDRMEVEDRVDVGDRMEVEDRVDVENRMTLEDHPDLEGNETRAAATEDAGLDVSIVSTREGFRFDRVAPVHAADLLGTTRDVVMLDCHERFRPNALGQVVGAVDGGGLLVLVTPPLADWPAIRDGFDEGLAVPPFGIDDVTGRFRERLVSTIRDHEGIAVVDVADAPSAEDGRGEDASDHGSAAVVRDPGLVDPSERTTDRSERSRDRSEDRTFAAPAGSAFPDAVYAACRTRDQVRAVRAFESLRGPGSASVVVESDRGRGKSSAAGLAAAAFALEGTDVRVTAPSIDAVGPLFDRVREVLSARNAIRTVGTVDAADEDGRRIETGTGGSVDYVRPPAAAERAGSDEADVLIVDEAAALPVATLEALLAAESVAFCTTIHGYEGAGRGFSVRFLDRLRADAGETGRELREIRLDQPIRYARHDPIERWAFRALLLDAAPVVAEAVADVRADGVPANDDSVANPAVTYRRLTTDDLLADERLLAETFGLLVFAHYRTEPNDLARLLDAPNLSVRALTARGHVIAVALLAREGGLSADRRAAMYEGERVRGNMVPDVLTSQLRDEDAGQPVGIRTMRIATHPALRRRGLGSHLLGRIHDEFTGNGAGDSAVDYFSVSYGATPDLVRFWQRAGYGTVHVSTTRNDASGERSAVMIRPTSAAGERLRDRHAAALRDRLRDGLSDALRDLDPDVAAATIAACPVDGGEWLSLTDRDWRALVAAADGPGGYEVVPGAARDLAFAALLDRDVSGGNLTDREVRLLIRVVLQSQPRGEVADELGYESTRQCLRALGAALGTLLDRYGGAVVAAERDRFER
ncbi:tRNA(Met) cytidine acetyltransferase TmcA [Halopenitus persicus]|uniref:tRNA(Met) cytidine acetyltransferase TmcA n=1 Tax=Halopenitus persicus TaxID=1048396 RepID=UPI000BBAF903|nr:tRNA(Met) cytidine acetyltransferase TmcA [Halopenitus persicus]